MRQMFPCEVAFGANAPTRFALIPRGAFLAGVLGAVAHVVEHLERGLLQESFAARGERARALGVDVEVLYERAHGHILDVVRFAALDAERKEAEVVYLHLLAVEQKLLDAGGHVPQYTGYAAFGVGRVVVGHVVGQTFEVNGGERVRVIVILAVGRAAGVVVFVSFK